MNERSERMNGQNERTSQCCAQVSLRKVQIFPKWLPPQTNYKVSRFTATSIQKLKRRVARRSKEKVARARLLLTA